MGDHKGYNQLHLNAFYDALNGIYADCVLEPDRKSHERAAFILFEREDSDLNNPQIVGGEMNRAFCFTLQIICDIIIQIK